MAPKAHAPDAPSAGVGAHGTPRYRVPCASIWLHRYIDLIYRLIMEYVNTMPWAAPGNGRSGAVGVG
jgi:hypothetical protein